MKKIQKFYNDTVVDGFNSSAHCIRISVVNLLIFTPFIILNIQNNYLTSICDDPLLCYGYLSFQRKPTFLVILNILCKILFNTFLFVYLISMLVDYFSTCQPIEKKKLYTSLFFNTPTLKIFNEEDKTNNLDFTIKTFNKFNECLKNDEESIMENLIINAGVFLTGFILIIVNPACSCAIFYLFKIIPTSNYFLVIYFFIFLE